MTTNTPGPWVLIPASAWDKVRGIAQGLADVANGKHGGALDADDVGADASNILDALKNVKPDPSPDLLSALEAMLADHEGCSDWGRYAGDDKARAAIAKAGA